MKNNSLIITLVVAIVVGGIAFFGGMKYQQSKANSSAGQYSGGQFGGPGGNGQRRFGADRGGFGGATVGQVVSSDANSITLQLMDGSSKIINISGSTTFSKSASASKSDVTTGARIAAFGTPNSDGSITAQNIQINPMMRGPRPSPTQ